MHHYVERLYDAYAQRFRIDEIYCHERSAEHEITIFHHALYGRVLTLDGVLQCTESDEFIYHEMLVHPAVFEHGAVRDVLLIGGGDGAALRQLCRHTNIQRITHIDIDAQVARLCQAHMPMLANGAFEDPRVTCHEAEGLSFVEADNQRYDLIVVDGADPVGPAQPLYQTRFYRACLERLHPEGVLVSQLGVDGLQLAQVKDAWCSVSEVFPSAWTYGVNVPSYVGGNVRFSLGKKALHASPLDDAQLASRYVKSGLNCGYYSPAVYRAAMTLPAYLSSLLECQRESP